MKRIISVTIAAVLMLICAVSCGAERDPKYVGKWEASTMKYDSTETDSFMGVPIAALFRFEIAEDGKVTWKSAIDNNIIQNANSGMDMTWKETSENKISFTVADRSGDKDTQKMELNYRDGMLVIGSDEGSVTLKKVDEFTEIDTSALSSAAGMLQNYNSTK